MQRVSQDRIGQNERMRNLEDDTREAVWSNDIETTAEKPGGRLEMNRIQGTIEYGEHSERNERCPLHDVDDRVDNGRGAEEQQKGGYETKRERKGLQEQSRGEKESTSIQKEMNKKEINYLTPR